MNFQFKRLTLKNFLMAILATGVFLTIIFSPKLAPHAWGGEVSSEPAYVCLETNSAAIREEMARILQDSEAYLVSCGDWHDFRVVANKQEYRHGDSMTEVEISFDVYNTRGNNVTWLPSMSSGPYYREEAAGRRIYNVSLQIQSVIRQNRTSYLELINSL